MDNKYQAQMLQDHVLRIQSNDIFKNQDTHLAEAKRHLQQVWLMLDAYRKKPPRRVIVVDVVGRRGETACPECRSKNTESYYREIECRDCGNQWGSGDCRGLPKESEE